MEWLPARSLVLSLHIWQMGVTAGVVSFASEAQHENETAQKPTLTLDPLSDNPLWHLNSTLDTPWEWTLPSQLHKTAHPCHQLDPWETAEQSVSSSLTHRSKLCCVKSRVVAFFITAIQPSLAWTQP